MTPPRSHERLPEWEPPRHQAALAVSRPQGIAGHGQDFAANALARSASHSGRGFAAANCAISSVVIHIGRPAMRSHRRRSPRLLCAQKGAPARFIASPSASWSRRRPRQVWRRACDESAGPWAMLSADRVAGSPGKLLLAGVIWAVEQGCRRSPAEARSSAADRARGGADAAAAVRVPRTGARERGRDQAAPPCRRLRAGGERRAVRCAISATRQNRGARSRFLVHPGRVKIETRERMGLGVKLSTRAADRGADYRRLQRYLELLCNHGGVAKSPGELNAA